MVDGKIRWPSGEISSLITLSWHWSYLNIAGLPWDNEGILYPFTLSSFSNYRSVKFLFMMGQSLAGTSNLSLTPINAQRCLMRISTLVIASWPYSLLGNTTRRKKEWMRSSRLPLLISLSVSRLWSFSQGLSRSLMIFLFHLRLSLTLFLSR